MSGRRTIGCPCFNASYFSGTYFFLGLGVGPRQLSDIRSDGAELTLRSGPVLHFLGAKDSVIAESLCVDECVEREGKALRNERTDSIVLRALSGGHEVTWCLAFSGSIEGPGFGVTFHASRPGRAWPLRRLLPPVQFFPG